MEEKSQKKNKENNNDKPKSPAANSSRKIVHIKKEGSFRQILQHFGIKKSSKNDLQRKTDIKSIQSTPNSPRPGTSRIQHLERSISSPNSPKESVKFTLHNPTCTDSSAVSTTETKSEDNTFRTTNTDAGVYKPPDYVKPPNLTEIEQESIEVKTTFAVTEKHATEYKMDHKRRGKCVIFNHEEFSNGEDPRPGTEKDVEKIRETFKTVLGFEVLIYDNLDCTDILDIIKTLSKDDYTDCDCLAIFVLTHGRSKGEISAKDMHYPVEKLWQPFTADNCISLAGKPKLFFINACRGKKKDSGIKTFFKRGTTQADGARRDGYKIPTHADFIIAQSTVEGFYSYREETGTWFIQTLCDTIQEHHETHDLLKILTITARKIAVNMTTHSDKKEDAELTQIPSFTSMLIRDVYFRPKT